MVGVMKGAAVAREWLQKSFGTQRNSIDEFTIYEFAGETIYNRALYTKYIDK